MAPPIPQLSIIIPARNEAENLPRLITEIEAALATVAPFEIIAVDDGSTDDSVSVLDELRSGRPYLRLVRHNRSGGQSAAIHTGVRRARAAIVCMLDGDGQNPPAELPRLVAPLLADSAGRLGLVAGQRVGRQDTWSKKLASRFANGLRGALLNDGTRDTGCGLKAFRRDAFLDLPYFNHMHRFLPALFKRDGWQVELVDVSHRPRQAGRSNYSNLQRALVGAIDLLGVMWLIRRGKKAQPVAGEQEDT